MRVIADRFVIVPTEQPRVGGMAKVYKALDTWQNGCFVAVKIFEAVKIQDDFLEESFLRETEALTTLKHPHIVELLASGREEATGHHFIALKWYEQSLGHALKLEAPLSWNDLAERLAFPLLEALALAHSRDVLHRDIKPANILLDEEGLPLLADFGIAKITDSLRFGVTMQTFASRPFASPEFGKGPSTARADIYSLGVTLLACLLPINGNLLQDNLVDALKTLPLEEQPRMFLQRLTALDPSDRPYNAEVALEELRRLLEDRPRDRSALPRLHLKISTKSAEGARTLLKCTDTELREVLVRDLQAGVTAIKLKEERQTGATVSQALSPDREESFSLLGQELSYHAALGRGGRDVLFILNISQLPASLMERLRESHMPLEANFAFQDPLHPRQAQQQLEELIRRLAEFASEQRIRENKAEEEEVIRTWGNILRAKKIGERLKEDPLSYNGFKVMRNGESARFTLDAAVDESTAEGLIGQLRRIPTRDKRDILGFVDDVVERELVLYVHRGNTALLPQRGQLLIDTTPSMMALRRQERALEALQTGGGVRSDLKNLLIHPEQVSQPTAQDSEVLDLLQSNLDSAKQEALRIALSAPDITAIQGPPGTGKTTWIAEFVCQFLKHSPRRHVLLSGQTHIAVDNALERIEKLAGKAFPNRPLKIIRVGPEEKIGAAAGRFRISEQMQIWADDVRHRSQTWLLQWAESQGISEERLTLGARLEELERAKRLLEEYRVQRNTLEARQTELETLQNELEELSDTVFSQASVMDKTIQSADDALENLLPVVASLRDATTSYVDLGLRLSDGIDIALTAVSLLASDGLDEQISSIRNAEMSQEQEVRTLQTEIADALGEPNLQETSLPFLREAVAGAMQAASEKVEHLRHLQALQTEWLQRFGSGADFEEALIGQADIVAGTCIGVATQKLEDLTFDVVVIDEASKATPTEALAAMTLGRKWVLVGDQNQLPPFADEALRQQGLLDKFELKPDDLRRTLFDRLIAGLPEKCRPRLSVQHRMVRQIGDLVSACFYGGDLKTGRTDTPMPLPDSLIRRPVTWLSTSRLSNRFEHASRQIADNPDNDSTGSGRSYLNQEESNQIRHWLTLLERQLNPEELGQPLHVGVISGYGAQKELLRKRLVPDSEQWKSLRIEINSVDAFQGREVDILIYSVTRSNQKGVLGFLNSPHRLNVALSRGKELLMIFGDSEHCRNAREKGNPFLDVLDYIDTHPEDCILEMLKETA